MFFVLKQAGLPAVCIETRHAQAAMVAMNCNKTDRNDARSISHLIRSGWFTCAAKPIPPALRKWRAPFTPWSNTANPIAPSSKG